MASENCALIFPSETKDSKQRLVKISFFIYIIFYLIISYCIDNFDVFENYAIFDLFHLNLKDRPPITP